MGSTPWDGSPPPWLSTWLSRGVNHMWAFYPQSLGASRALACQTMCGTVRAGMASYDLRTLANDDIIHLP
jgi:hypothetical protein